MEAVPARARAYVACVAVAALLCLLPLSAVRTSWWELALLAALSAGCERAAARWRFMRHLPSRPAHAASFCCRPRPPPSWRCRGRCCPRSSGARAGCAGFWRAAQLAVSVWAAARVHWSMGGRDAVVASDFPYALAPAGVAVLVLCLVLSMLDGGSWFSPSAFRYGGPGTACFSAPSDPSPCTGWPDS